MNKQLKKKIIIDVIILVLFLLELNLGFTGLFLHELFGLLAGAGIIIHLLLNKQWIKNISKVFNNKHVKMKLCVVLNIFLFVTTIIMLVSGVVISRELFKFNVYNYIIITIHKLFGYITGVTIILHILMHFNFLKGNVSRIVKNKNVSAFKKGLLVVLISFLTIFTLYTMVDKLLLDNEERNQYVEKEKKEEDEEGETKNDSSNENQTEKEETVVKEEKELPPTLNDFLSKLTCNGCGKHCSLLSPRCGKGSKKQEAAKTEYYQTYGE